MFGPLGYRPPWVILTDPQCLRRSTRGRDRHSERTVIGVQDRPGRVGSHVCAGSWLAQEAARAARRERGRFMLILALGRWARRRRACAKHRTTRQASTVDLSAEIGAGQGAVQGRERNLGTALFHAGLALGLSRRDEAGSISMRAGDRELAIGVGSPTSTVKSKPPTRPSSRQSLTTVSKTCR